MLLHNELCYLVKSGGTGVVTNDCMGFRWTCWNMSRISGLFEISSLLLQEWSCFTPPTQKTRQTQQITEISNFLCLNKEINMSFYEKNTMNPFTSGEHEKITREVLTQD